ncbi:hypothetical protein B0T17DRAFT_509690 [Bombardia bombarda]|uniref:Uncharacterized protein n=1 Tax=Bombardia bombarda TaxID=252184 RepID=A0AA39WMH5_9PEZI|nr:hypothetical protein B0T17DRAFT_509690 [Bombardia bombarda]
MASLGSFLRDDRVILGTMAVSAVGLVLLMRSVLERLRDEAEIKPAQPKTQYITQDTEDSLKADTLDTLLGHYNCAIRDTAAKIVSERAVHEPSTVDILLWGITRPDYDERMKSLRALATITDPQSLKNLQNRKAYSALVRSLELSLDPEQETLGDDDWDDYPLRDMTEKLCFMFFSQLIRDTTEAERLVKVGFVDKWLAKQNWGDSDESRVKNFAQYMQHRDNRITSIVSILQRTIPGSAALKDAGLIPEGTTCDAADELSRNPEMGQEYLLLQITVGGRNMVGLNMGYANSGAGLGLWTRALKNSG